LVTFICDDTVPYLAAAGATAEVLLELFECTTGEPMADSPGIALVSLCWAFAKVLRNIALGVLFDTPLLSVTKRGCLSWSRVPRVSADVAAWLAGPGGVHRGPHNPGVRRRTQMASVDAGLAARIRGHEHPRPAEVDSGKPSMALLLLWEVDHDMPFPSRTAGGLSDTLLGYTRRLTAQVRADNEPQGLLVSREMQIPLAPGLVAPHHMW
jgi:hypothetical protein